LGFVLGLAWASLSSGFYFLHLPKDQDRTTSLQNGTPAPSPFTGTLPSDEAVGE